MVVSWSARSSAGMRSGIVLLTCFCVACSGESCRVGRSAPNAPAIVDRPVPVDAKLEVPAVATAEPTADEVAASLEVLGKAAGRPTFAWAGDAVSTVVFKRPGVTDMVAPGWSE
jgi:hypothetical protein